MQIKLRIGTNTKRTTVMVEDSFTPKKALEQEGIDYSTATVSLDGCPLSTKEMNSTFETLGITESAHLIATIKTDNAA
jgi:hypothetical protein